MLPKQAHDFGNVGRYRLRAASHDHQKGFVLWDVRLGGFQGFFDAFAGGPNHLHVDPEFPAVMDVHTRVLRHVSVENGGNVKLDVPGSEQHAGQREDFRISFLPQGIQAGADHRRRELQEPMIDIDVGRRSSSVSARTANSRIALASRLPVAAKKNSSFTGHGRCPVRMSRCRSLVVVDGFGPGAQDLPVL